MNEKKSGLNIRQLTITGTILIVALAVGIYVVYKYDPAETLKTYLESGVHPAVFLSLMLVLPLLGVPISIFLVLIGMKFGIVAGLFLSAVIMFCHMAITYYLVHTFMRQWIVKMLAPYKVSIPRLREDKNRWHAFFFMLIPGLPYIAKNNLLALAEVPFVSYMTINWTAQYGLSIPMIILGGAILEMNLKILSIAVALILAGYLLQHYLRKKYRNFS